MDQRIARDGGGCGKDQRHDQAQDGSAQRLEQQSEDAKPHASGNEANQPGTYQAGAGLIGELRSSETSPPFVTSHSGRSFPPGIGGTA